MLKEGHHRRLPRLSKALSVTCYNLCFSQRCSRFSRWGPGLPPLPQRWRVKDGGRRGSSAAIYTIDFVGQRLLSEGRKYVVVACARRPYLMVFLLVVVLETILTLLPVLEPTPRPLPELKVLPPP